MIHVPGKKLNSKKGFTLAELLIVVAIIAVLVAIMIPVFGSSRANAIQAKDAANVRSVYAEAVTEAMGAGATTEATKSGYLTVGTGDTAKTLLNVLVKDKITHDSSTTVTYEPSDATNNAGGTITISTTGASATVEKITVDDDVKLDLEAKSGS